MAYMGGAKTKAQALIGNQSWHVGRNRCLDALTLGMIGACRLAESTIAIPLRNTGAGRG
jgi:hypothetical protein